MDEPAPSPEDLQKENRALARRLARLDTNVRQMEEMQDSTSKLLSSVMRELDEERARSHSLLLNILPQAIIDRLDAGEETIADRYDSVTVLFSDLVGFTAISSDLDPQQLVTELNRLFSEFDALCERCEVEKIKTIGDAYLAVGGLPGTREDHAAAVAELALGMVEAVARLNASSGRDWKIRVGIHTGPAVAGVIGTRKFVYDVWGDTVNVASRLESSSEPNAIHVSEPVADELRGSYDLEPRGVVELKGKGETKTYRLRGPSAAR
jgi:class 3 adenylate cyclase